MLFRSALALAVPAQEVLNPPVPLLRVVAGGASAGEDATALVTARRAHDLGLPGVAADLYRRILEGGTAEPGAVALALMSALLDAGRLGEAERVQAEFARGGASAWRLRAGLLAAQRRLFDQARAELAAVREADLSPEDAPWLSFLQAEVLVGQGTEFPRARDLYAKAEASARSEMARARFALAGEVLRLRMGAPREADRKSTRLNSSY